MLQIASGRLFRGKPAQRNQLRGVLYTNLEMYHTVIDTAAGRLSYTSTLHDSKTLIYEFTELIEDDVLLSHGIDPYLSDFAAVVSFALNVTCTPDHDLTLRLLGGHPGPSVQYPPSQLVRRIFDDRVFCRPEDEVQLFELVGQLISLKRRSFLAAMRAIRSYVTGLHRLADDYELAHTLLVVSMESLAQDFDDFDPRWEDYDQRKRTCIDAALTGADEDVAARVRTALLEMEHVALGRRFRAFVLDHLQPSYFRGEARDLVNPMTRADLDAALRQAYRLRSQYIHELKELPAILKIPGQRDTTSLGHEVVLTFQGLARLAHHVISTFIERRPKVHREEYDYSGERAGILQVQMAPQYWIGDVAGLDPHSGPERLEGFLKQVAACLSQEPGATVTDLRKALTQVEGMLPEMSTDQRRPFIALYVLFNQLTLRNDKMPNYEDIVDQYRHELVDPSVESLLTFLLLGTDLEWTQVQRRDIHDAYFRQRGHRNGLRVRPILEAGLCLDLAERYRQEGDVAQALDLICSAVENHPGHAALIELERERERDFDLDGAINWRDVAAPSPIDEADGATS